MKNKKETLKDFKKKALHTKDTLFPILFIDPISIRIAYLIKKLKLKITPTEITLIRLLFLSPLIIFLLFLAPISESRILYLFVAILFYLVLFSDWLDGELARGTDTVSSYGAIMDSISDRFAIIIFFTLVFSIGLLFNNIWIIFGSIILFVLKTFHLIIVSMKLYHDKGKTKDKDKFFTEEPARKAMGLNSIFSFIVKLSKILKIKRWHGTIGASEQYTLTVIILSLLVFFSFDAFVLYFTYLLIVFFALFYLFRIKALLKEN